MVNAFQYTLFYYTPLYYYNPSYFQLATYRDAIATRKITGVTFGAYYPFNKYYRTQASIGYYKYEEDVLDPSFGSLAQFWNGNQLAATFSLLGETTRFKYPYGPTTGNTFKLSLTQAIPVSTSFLMNTTVESDLRQYLNIGGDALFAFRFRGFSSRGKNPYLFYWGGNNEVRSMGYYSIIANEGWYANLEFRLPLINAASTIIGQIGPVRGVLFFDLTRAKIKGSSGKMYNVNKARWWEPSDAIGSYGYGFEFFFLGLPIHLEFVKSLDILDISHPLDINTVGKFRTKFWIGFDF